MSHPATAVIPAAGYGSRLDIDTSHKILVSVGGKSLLDHHLQNFRRLGVDDVVVVTGYRSERLAAAVDEFVPPEGMEIHCAHNPEFDGENGRTVLAGARHLEQRGKPTRFWLAMSDHLFDPGLFDGVVDRLDAERTDRWEGALFVDRKLEAIFDMPDATKLRIADGGFAIGKQLPEFDVVDTGLFWCDTGFVDALRDEKAERGDCSTSDAVRRLYRDGRFGFVDVGDHLWQDVDTPPALEHAEKLWAEEFG